ncbi:hypothetical protein BJ508DRAFT_335731 [Ascobolus immersus RN42]|uniref:Extracellular membrane protein CFEM domain-containing protein n=1 Tax=Ascobolus immersus RN42 TaxID=1160509 RepID=A0A3N4HFU9_ASCIM|nr:hypothetical protein BJ508DRAFT_335731 [Ascobolus immersus RN42]
MQFSTTLLLTLATLASALPTSTPSAYSLVDIPRINKYSTPAKFLNAFPTCSHECAQTFFNKNGCSDQKSLAAGWGCYCSGRNKDISSQIDAFIKCGDPLCLPTLQGSPIQEAFLMIVQVETACAIWEGEDSTNSGATTPEPTNTATEQHENNSAENTDATEESEQVKPDGQSNAQPQTTTLILSRTAVLTDASGSRSTSVERVELTALVGSDIAQSNPSSPNPTAESEVVDDSNGSSVRMVSITGLILAVSFCFLVFA